MTNSYNETSGASSYTPSLKRLELQNTHEQIQLKEQHEHEARMAELKYSQEKTLKDKDCAHEQALKDKQLTHEESMENKALGWFGQYFGSKEHSSRNITAIICLSFIAGATLVSLLVYFCKEDLTFVKYMWGVTSPIITLSLGYLFGHKR